MKLQLALDTDSLLQALQFTEKVADYVDIIEIGTPLVIAEGMHAVRTFRQFFDHKEILADLKIMDGGAFEAEEAFDAGADYATVLGVTDLLTAKGAIAAAQRWQRQIVIDMICVANLPGKIHQMEELGAHCLAVHTGADQQASGRTPLEDLQVMRAHAKHSKIAVAGGINSRSVAAYAALQPEIIIVGSGLTSAADPVAEAAAIKTILQSGK